MEEIFWIVHNNSYHKILTKDIVCCQILYQLAINRDLLVIFDDNDEELFNTVIRFLSSREIPSNSNHKSALCDYLKKWKCDITLLDYIACKKHWVSKLECIYHNNERYIVDFNSFSSCSLVFLEMFSLDQYSVITVEDKFSEEEFKCFIDRINNPFSFIPDNLCVQVYLIAKEWKCKNLISEWSNMVLETLLASKEEYAEARDDFYEEIKHLKKFNKLSTYRSNWIKYYQQYYDIPKQDQFIISSENNDRKQLWKDWVRENITSFIVWSFLVLMAAIIIKIFVVTNQSEPTINISDNFGSSSFGTHFNQLPNGSNLSKEVIQLSYSNSSQAFLQATKDGNFEITMPLLENGATPEITPIMTQDVSPVENNIETPMITNDLTPTETNVETPQETPEYTPIISSVETPELTIAQTHVETPFVFPVDTIPPSIIVPPMCRDAQKNSSKHDARIFLKNVYARVFLTFSRAYSGFSHFFSSILGFFSLFLEHARVLVNQNF